MSSRSRSCSKKRLVHVLYVIVNGQKLYAKDYGLPYWEVYV